MSAEVWRPVPDRPGYEVSNLGRLRSFRRNPSGVIIKGCLLRGYRSTCLRGKVVRFHHLVAAAFLGPRPDGLETRHIDGDKTNNRVENLVYGTHSQNILDQVAHGSHNQARKTHCIRGHAFDEANTYHYKGHRQCRACGHARYLRRLAARAAA